MNLCYECGLELSKQLKENGYPQDESLFYWRYISGVWNIKYYEKLPKVMWTDEIFISAPTVAELGEALPSYISVEGDQYQLEIHKDDDQYLVDYRFFPSLFRSKSSTNLSQALGEMWLYLTEEGLL